MLTLFDWGTLVVRSSDDCTHVGQRCPYCPTGVEKTVVRLSRQGRRPGQVGIAFLSERLR